MQWSLLYVCALVFALWFDVVDESIHSHRVSQPASQTASQAFVQYTLIHGCYLIYRRNASIQTQYIFELDY